MKTTRMITADMLSEHKACTGQYELFCMTWPDGCKVTLEDCKKAVRLGFDIYWAARRLLGKAELKTFDEAVATARKAYYEAIAPAQKAYNEATAPAQKEFDEAAALALNAYNEAVAPARKAYREAFAPVQKEYEEAVAPAQKAFDEVVVPSRKAYNEAKVIAFYEAWHRA